MTTRVKTGGEEQIESGGMVDRIINENVFNSTDWATEELKVWTPTTLVGIRLMKPLNKMSITINKHNDIRGWI